jgi:outer membrane protein assembly factor BamB
MKKTSTSSGSPQSSISRRLRQAMHFLLLWILLIGIMEKGIAEENPPGPVLKWTYDQINIELSSPVIGPDGTVYVGSVDVWPHQGGVYAFKPDGTLKWEYHPAGAVQAAPAVGPDGTVYAGDERGNFFAFTPDGSVKWKYSTGYAIHSSPAVGYQGCVYFGCKDGFLYAFHPDGRLRWKHRAGRGTAEADAWYNIESSPVVAPDGTVYVASKDRFIYAITPNGNRKWVTAVTGGGLDSAPAVGPDGTLYYNSNDNRVYAINPDGTLRWKFVMNAGGYSSPGIDAEGTVYFGGVFTDGHFLVAVNPDGLEKWRFPIPDTAGSSPAIGTDGTIYMGSSDRNLYAINPNGSLKWKFFLESWHHNCPAIAPDGTVYIGAKKLIALQTGSFGYQPGAPWPAFTAFPARSVLDSSKVTEPVLHTVRGQVAMPDSIPLVEADVSADGLMARTDEFGFYSFRLPDGKYTITIHVNSVDIPDSVAVVVNGADVFVELYPPVKHLVRGRLLDREGPLAGIDVFAGPLTVKTDLEGRFSFLLPEGRHALEFETGNRYFLNTAGITVNGADVDLETIYLNPILWSNTAIGEIEGPPAVGKDGTVYLLSGLGREHHIASLDPGGKLLGRYDIDTYFADPPLLGKDGTIYITTWGSIIALNPDLSPQWTFPIAELGAGSPLTASTDGTLYFGSNEQVYALNPNGVLKWKRPVAGRICPAPAIGSDGLIYFVSDNGALYAFAPDGNLKWTFKTGEAIFITPAIGIDGTIFFGSYDHHFYALKPDGTLRWKYETKSVTSTNLAQGNDGVFYSVTQDNVLYAISPDGTLKWEIPGVDSGRGLWVYPPTGKLWVWRNGITTILNSDGTVQWEHKVPYIFPASGPNGRVYLSTNNPDYLRTGYLHAIDMDEHNTGPVLVEDSSEIRSSTKLPHPITLARNYPNPFNPKTVISFTLTHGKPVTVDIFNASGQHVEQLLDDFRSAGEHRLTWNASTRAAGLYLVRVRAERESVVRKMMLVK